MLTVQGIENFISALQLGSSQGVSPALEFRSLGEGVSCGWELRGGRREWGRREGKEKADGCLRFNLLTPCRRLNPWIWISACALADHEDRPGSPFSIVSGSAFLPD